MSEKKAKIAREISTRPNRGRSMPILFRRKLFKKCFGRETFDVRLYRCSNSTRDFTIAHRSEKVKERSLLRSLKIRLLLLAPISTFT